MGSQANQSKAAPEGDLEDGELELAAGPQLQPPDAPPSPPASEAVPGEEDWQNLSGKKNKAKRKQLRKAMNAGTQVSPNLYRAIYGQQAKAEVEIQANVQSIKPQDVQALVLWVLADRKESRNPPWVAVKNIPLIRQVVLLYIPGISAAMFAARQDLFMSMRKLGKPVSVLAKDALVRPGYSLAILMRVPYSKEKKQYINETAAGLGASGSEGGQQFPPSHYVLKADMMAKMGYPLPERLSDGELQVPEGFVVTKPSRTEGGAEDKPDVLLALDCEMCETLPGVFELTRISLLNQQKEVLFDQLVLPRNEITNYHTDKSGISAATLTGITTRLEEVQARFLELVPAEAILVGHALENDLKALKVVHMRCIDTGALFPHPKGLPFRSALRRLAERFLKRKIQDGSHDPVIDATAALDLALLKMKHGPAFGLGQQIMGEPLPEVLMRANRHCTLVDKPDTLNKYLSGCADGVSCSGDEEVTDKLEKQVARGHPTDEPARFVWGQLRGLSVFYEARADAQRRDAAAAAAAEDVTTTGQAVEASGKPGDESSPSQNKRSLNGDAAGSDLTAKRQRLDGSADVASASPAAAGEGGSSGAEAMEAVQVETVAKTTAAEVEDGEKEDSEEERLIRLLDRQVHRIYEALPRDTLLVVTSCQGDTAATRLQYEQKVRRSQGLQKPPWSREEENRYNKEFAQISQRGICLAAVK